MYSDVLQLYTSHTKKQKKNSLAVRKGCGLWTYSQGSFEVTERDIVEGGRPT